jgi:predicted O-linked N-acetylglucosamine transferase (SPINDLY family)
MPELIAPDVAGCTALATALSADRERLSAARARLAALIPGAPIFDTRRLVRGLEQAYGAMWQRHRSGEPPAAIDLSEPPYAA